MENRQKNNRTRKFGLIGRDISYSFSSAYFSEKFIEESIHNTTYQNFDIPIIEKFENIIKQHPELKGLNVTIPYKEEIIPFLDALDSDAQKIGAVNTIKISERGIYTGYNTDHFGFRESLMPFLKNTHQSALILGTGGASKAITYTLEKLGLDYKYVSRKKYDNHFIYKDLSKKIIQNSQLIINCTPVGTFPDVELCPDIPYQYINETHILYDLIYNPKETQFLKLGKRQGAIIINGLEMLKRQAEKAWEIWNS